MFSDNVFITSVISVQYQVLRDKVYEGKLDIRLRPLWITLKVTQAHPSPPTTLAFYSLTNPAQQITAHVYDVIRSQLPNLELDSVFEAKEDLALEVKNALTEIMTSYGYQIVQVLITDLDPDQRVKVRTLLFCTYFTCILE